MGVETTGVGAEARGGGGVRGGTGEARTSRGPVLAGDRRRVRVTRADVSGGFPGRSDARPAGASPGGRASQSNHDGHWRLGRRRPAPPRPSGIEARPPPTTSPWALAPGRGGPGAPLHSAPRRPAPAPPKWLRRGAARRGAASEVREGSFGARPPVRRLVAPTPAPRPLSRVGLEE